jgi:hypothetical protein
MVRTPTIRCRRPLSLSITRAQRGQQAHRCHRPRKQLACPERLRAKALGTAARRGTTRSMRTLTAGDLRLIRPRGPALAGRLPRATPTGAWGGRIRCRSSLPLKRAPRRPALFGERLRQQRSPRSASSMATSGRARSTHCKRSSNYRWTVYPRGRPRRAFTDPVGARHHDLPQVLPFRDARGQPRRGRDPGVDAARRRNRVRPWARPRRHGLVRSGPDLR